MSTDNDVDVSAQVPEADAAEQQMAIDSDDASLDLDRVADPSEAVDHASQADLIEQKQVLPARRTYTPTPTPTREPHSMSSLRLEDLLWSQLRRTMRVGDGFWDQQAPAADTGGEHFAFSAAARAYFIVGGTYRHHATSDESRCGSA